MRVGEICGLQWQDFNFKQGSLSVTKTVERISLGNGKTKVVVEPPKTESSIRKVYMPPFITALLNDHKDTPEKYVLTGKLKPSEPRALQYKFKRILGKTNKSGYVISLFKAYICYALHRKRHGYKDFKRTVRSFRCKNNA